jgi:transposase
LERSSAGHPNTCARYGIAGDALAFRGYRYVETAPSDGGNTGGKQTGRCRPKPEPDGSSTKADEQPKSPDRPKQTEGRLLIPRSKVRILHGPSGAFGRGRRSTARAGVWGGDKTGASPVDRARSGSKHHLIACGRGTPLACSLTGGNRNDITQMIPLLDAIPQVRGRHGQPRRRPRSLYGDRAYHSREGRGELRRRHIQAKIAWPRSGHGSGLGTKRWVVERTIAWLHQYRRLRIRYERRDDIHEAFLAIACTLICLTSFKPEAHSERRS